MLQEDAYHLVAPLTGSIAVLSFNSMLDFSNNDSEWIMFTTKFIFVGLYMLFPVQFPFDETNRPMGG